MTSEEGVFVAGDMGLGQSLIVWATLTAGPRQPGSMPTSPDAICCLVRSSRPTPPSSKRAYGDRTPPVARPSVDLRIQTRRDTVPAHKELCLRQQSRAISNNCGLGRRQPPQSLLCALEIPGRSASGWNDRRETLDLAQPGTNCLSPRPKKELIHAVLAS
jgi:hypothetical protein